MSVVPLVQPAEKSPHGPIIGACGGIRRAVDLARRFAPTPLPILVVGPTGTGKELFAQHIHAWSGRRGALVDVNCGALPRDLMEGLLFGHRRGIFTGATETTSGLLEAAHGGTLYLDELGNLPFDAQGKLLRVLETGEVRRLGETEKRRTDFRIVCAAQTPLAAEVASGAFRLELLQRVAGVVIELPPLSERGEDVVLLAHHFAAAHNQVIAAEAERVLFSYGWPGNVRELFAAVSRALWLAGDAVVNADVIREAIGLGAGLASSGNRPVPDPDPDLARARSRLVEVCEMHAWQADQVAAFLRISRATLYRRLGELGISLRHLRKVSQFVVRQSENF